MKSLLIIITLISVCHLASAEIYEVIDEEGNKTYTNTKPLPSKQGQVKTIEIGEIQALGQNEEQDANNKEFFSKLKTQQDATENYKRKRSKAIKDYNKKLNQADQAVIDAPTTQEGDFIPILKGGMRYTDQYHKRIAQTKKDLEDLKANKKYYIPPLEMPSP